MFILNELIMAIRVLEIYLYLWVATDFLREYRLIAAISVWAMRFACSNEVKAGGSSRCAGGSMATGWTSLKLYFIIVKDDF